MCNLPVHRSLNRPGRRYHYLMRHWRIASRCFWQFHPVQCQSDQHLCAKENCWNAGRYFIYFICKLHSSCLVPPVFEEEAPPPGYEGARSLREQVRVPARFVHVLWGRNSADCDDLGQTPQVVDTCGRPPQGVWPVCGQVLYQSCACDRALQGWHHHHQYDAEQL